MKGKTIAGFALLLGIVMVGAFISGCIDQGNVTRTVSSPDTSTTTQSPAPGNELESKEKELRALIEEYDGVIEDAREKLAKTGFELQSEEIMSWDKSSAELLEMAGNENDPGARVLILNELAKLKYYELANLRTLAGIGALESAYWENATTGEPIEPFYNMRGAFFYISGKGIEELDRAGIVERMKKVQGYEMESLEIYHPGTGSTLRAIREGGRTVGAGQIVSITVGAGNGATLEFNSPDMYALRLIDPNTGETVMKVSPDGNGNYYIPPVNTTLLGIADDVDLDKLKEICKPLPPDTTVLTPMPVGDEPLICPSPGIAPFIFEPTGDGINQTPAEELYLLPEIRYESKLVAVDIGVPAEGMRLQVTGNISYLGPLVLTDPKTGRELTLKPGENRTYTIPSIRGEVIGSVTAQTDPPGGGFCYRPLELNINTTLEPMEICEEEFVLRFGPSENLTVEKVYAEKASMVPKEYTVTTLVMKADLKELAEQLVNINMRVGNGVITVGTPTKALDAFQDAITNAYSAEMRTQEKCSCTVSPLLDNVFGRTFGGPFNEVPEPKAINITDFGTGPYIPIAWEKLENQSSVVVVYAITGPNGDTLIAIGDPGAKQGTKKPSAERLASNYLDRVYIEVFTGRNAAGEEIKVVAFKVLNTNGTVGLRSTTITRNPVRVVIMNPGIWEK